MKKTEYDRLYARLLKEFDDEKKNLIGILEGFHPEQSPYLMIYLQNTQYAFQRLAALKSIEPYV